jgi:DNA mismatch repair protein MutS2
MRRGATEAGRIWGRGIEWDAVRDLLAREAKTRMGQEASTGLEPLTEPEAIRAALDVTGQARRALAEVGPPPLGAFPDIRAVLEHCDLDGVVLDGTELILILGALEFGPQLIAWGRGARPTAPELASIAERIPLTRDLHERLRRALEEDGSLKDDASPRLRHLRREIRDRRRRLVSDLERLFQSSEADRTFADRYVTVRHGRYVVPVRAEARARITGIVHDRSQSGQTLFIEPTSAVDANNDLVQLAREEEAETTRIFSELTAAVRAQLADLQALVTAAADLDLAFARAALAERMEAAAPIIDEGRTVALREARHPLLLAQQWSHPDRPVVPVDLELTPDRPLVVITGPNAGGKTIALKTLALQVLMAQSGLHVPAAEGSRLPVFTQVHAIIGDDQSVAENLSTFSAFVKQVRQILAEADPQSLVLLDELGAGTDPDEGAALAQAILETLAERGALVLATTHLEPLKAFASTHPRARNASVEFDATALTPTFRLRYDRPGQSLALTIAARLGLPAELIARAQAHRSEHAARLSELIARLDAHTRAEAERSLAIEQREQEAAAALTAAREAEATADRRAHEVLDRARAEATRILSDIKRAVAAEWDRLKRAPRSRRDLEDTRRRLNDAAAQIAPPPSTAPPEMQEALAPGAFVSAEHLGLKGELVAVTGETATVRSGAITIRVPVTALRPTPPQPAGDRAHGAGWERGRLPERIASLSEGASPAPTRRHALATELLLLGKTTDEARDMVEKYLDDAFMAGLGSVRLVHGKGTGALRKMVRGLLAAHPLVESYRDGEPSEGGTGATVALMKVS